MYTYGGPSGSFLIAAIQGEKRALQKKQDELFKKTISNSMLPAKNNIYEKRSGFISIDRPPYKIEIKFHAMFKRESDLITYVTFARSYDRYYSMIINAKILTFYDYGIAYILDMDVIDISTDYMPPSYTRVKKGSFESYNYISEILKPNGINEIRFMDGPICLEAFILMRKSFNNISKKQNFFEVMKKISLPNDVLEHIYNINNDIEIKKILNENIEISQCKPFKVQGFRHGSKMPIYTVVLLNHILPLELDNNSHDWNIMRENPYEESEENEDEYYDENGNLVDENGNLID